MPPPSVPALLPDTVLAVSVSVPPLKMPPPFAASFSSTVLYLIVTFAPSTMRRPPPLVWLPPVIVRDSTVEVPEPARNTRDWPCASTVMSARSSPLTSPSITTSLEITSWPSASVSVPVTANLIVSAPTLPFASAKASRNDSPAPSGVPVVSPPSNASSMSVVTMKSAMAAIVGSRWGPAARHDPSRGKALPQARKPNRVASISVRRPWPAESRLEWRRPIRRKSLPGSPKPQLAKIGRKLEKFGRVPFTLLALVELLADMPRRHVQRRPA